MTKVNQSQANGRESETVEVIESSGGLTIARQSEPATLEASPPLDLDDPSLYINRELSTLEFQKRVLEEAQDPRNPLLERVKFLAIVASLHDEFFMVRVGGLKLQIKTGVINLPPDGLTPAEQLAAIRRGAQKLMREYSATLVEELLPLLTDHGIRIFNYDELNKKQKANVQKYFDEVVFPVLTPLAIDPGHPFPHISNLSLNLAILIRDQNGREFFARVKVPSTLPRFVPIRRSSGGMRKDGTVPFKHHFIWLEQVIGANLDKLFPGMDVVETHPFHVTRNADLVIQELEADDLLETMEESVRERQFGSVVRVTFNQAMPPNVREILVENLILDPNDIYILEGPLDLSNLMSLYNIIDRYDLFEIPFLPATPPQLNKDLMDGDVYAAIQRKDILLHHPYDSFLPVVELLQKAARDPDVLAIKQTLYRVGRNSPVVEALLEARENGKQVAVLVELKARFDEKSNIDWAKRLEQKGVHVVYGLLGLKTHSKIALIVCKEGGRIQRYVHLGTGNYNLVTAHQYEDLGLITSDAEIGADASDLFNYLTGYSAISDFSKLLVAPINMRERLESLIKREIEHQRQGNRGHIIFKTNSIVDKGMIQLLYQASQAGVKVDLIVRSICCLRPGLPGFSENITVTSIVGRFLEHSRIYYFRNCGDDEIYLGSADLMPRNLDRRVEVLFPIEDPGLVQDLRDDILAIYLSDNVIARRMNSDGTYIHLSPGDGETPLNSQVWFLRQKEQKKTEFGS